MPIARRARAALIATLLLVGSIPLVPAVSAASPTIDAAVSRGGPRAIDPTIYVPERGADLRGHPEATIGFHSRSLPKPMRAEPDRRPGTGAGKSAAAASSGTPADEPATRGSAGTAASAPIGGAPAVRAAQAPAGSAPIIDSVTDPVAPTAGTPQVKGTIKGPGNVALSGVYVCLDDPSGTPLCIGQTQTAANGTYAIPIAAGSYNVRVYDPTGDHVPGYWSAGGLQTLMVNAGVVVVSSSDVTGIDIVDPLFPMIHGTLQDEHGAAIEGRLVEGALYATDTTDAAGAFDIKVWPNSDSTLRTYWTQVYKGGWYHTGGGYAEDQAGATTIHVGSSDVSGIVFVNPHWPKVSGHVTDVNGDPVAGLQMLFYRSSYDSVTTYTDADGAYVFYAFNGGGWSVQFGGGPPFEWVTETHPVDGAVDVTVDFVAHRLPVVSGVLTGPHGEPVAGVTVHLLGGYYDDSTDVTDADGSFSIRWIFGPYPSLVYVRFDATDTWVGGYLGDSGIERNPSPAKQFALNADEVLDASGTMAAWVHLTGHMRWSTGEGMVGGPISVTGSGWSASQQAGVDGAFDFKLPPGSYRLGVQGGSYGQEGFAYLNAAAVPIAVGADGRDVDVTLPAGHQIRGKVTAGSTPLSGVEVDVYLEGFAFTSTHTQADGTYAVDVPPGVYQVGFFQPGGAHAHGFYGPAGYTSDPALAKDVAVGTGDATGVNVSLPVTRHIAGKVVDATSVTHGAPYVFVEAFVNGVYYSSKYASSSGTFSLPVAPGKVTLWVYDAYQLFYAPGWRTATSISASFSNAAVTTVGTADVSGVTIKVPEAVLLTLHPSGIDASYEAIGYGGVASFDVVDASANHFMPVLKGTYAIWVDGTDTPYLDSLEGWWRGTGMTPDYSLATKKAVTGNATITINAPVRAILGGAVTDSAGGGIPKVDVQIWSNGTFYTDVVTNAGGGWSIAVLPGTYRVAYADLYGEYVEGWLGDSGYVAGYASATDVVVSAGGYASPLNAALPLGATPTAPYGVTAVPYHQSALVSFSPVVTPAGRPILHYAVTASPGGRQCIAAVQPSCTVTGLGDGTPYTFTVTASTIVGSGPASSASALVSPHPVPAAPGSVVATPTAHDVAVSWSAPADNGSAITGYLVTASPGGATCAPVPATDTGCTISGLGDGPYTFAVTATNAVGDGPAGTAGAIVDTAPPTVTAPVTTLKSGLPMTGTAIPVTVAWTASDSLAGVADTTLERAYGAGSYVDQVLASPTATSLITTLASSSAAYRFRDRAQDGSGNLSGYATGPSSYVLLRQETGTGIVYSGSWTTPAISTALGGKARTTTAKGASVTYTFTGKGVSFITRKGTTNSKASVYLDGKLVYTVDTYASSTVARWVAWATTGTTSTTHVLKIVNLATTGRTRLYIDGFATIR